MKKEPGRTDWLRDLCEPQQCGQNTRGTGRRRKAFEYYLRSHGDKESLVKKEPGRTDWLRELGVSLSYVGRIHEGLGNVEKALGYYRRTLEIRRLLVEKEPRVVDRHVGLALALLDMFRVTEDEDVKRQRVVTEACTITKSLVDSEV